MFEYAVSQGKGKLIDYGVKIDPYLEGIWNERIAYGFPKWCKEMVMHIPFGGRGLDIKCYFRPASPDCTTGQ